MEVIGQIIDPLSGYIRPITALIPEPVENIGVSLLGDKCYDTLIRKVDFVSNPDCVALAISRALGLGIVGMSSIVKVPQILKLVASRSAEGLSLVSFVLETIGYFISLSYGFRMNFPFTTFGETALIGIQNFVICFLILQYSGKKTLAALFFAAISSFVYILVDPTNAGYISDQQMTLLQGLTIPLSLFSKIPQVLANYKNKSTGQLSAFSVINYLAGSLARVFTTFQEVNDPIILSSFVGATILNAILAIQLVLYWSNSNKPITSEKKKTK
ncbi:hypothetical protein D0Z00_004305 [Geotrichum galactomycetum]|uniref:Uncharacterized protein n=1 Tax=Geotrichum galactomycetum TaxID=27317 RepID=A0ACB6UYV2_9ASCO|nr:hypothetical protein D0Z00_004305 [Geotrichum candidum]